MANILGTHTLNGILILKTDTNPALTGGISAPVGSFCSANDGSGVFYKSGALDTDWTGLANRQTWFDLTSVIVGASLNLAHLPVSMQGYYLNGQRCEIGIDKIIVSIVGTLVTFNMDYTGQDFTETYNY